MPTDIIPTPPIQRHAIFVIIALVALSDLLFWGHSAGLSLVVFSAALTGAALWDIRPSLSPRGWAAFIGVWIALAIPTLEYVQFTSLTFLWVGHLSLVLWAALRGETRIARILRLPIGYILAMGATATFLAGRVSRRSTRVAGSTLKAWVLPMSVGFVFVILFLAANPVLENLLSRLSYIEADPDIFDRIFFWGAFAALVLPFTAFRLWARSTTRIRPVRQDYPKPASAYLNARSITNALILFNALFAVQNLTDGAILWLGANLPEGMTYATYAHRGAYPLMATSLLAGLFALISRPFAEDAPLLRVLLMIWVVQNVVLLGSAILRLDLYIEAYGLTYLRLRAGIGMGMVVVGMGLMLWQITKDRTNAWLLARVGIMVAAVFYVGSLVNFGYVITSYNLARADSDADFEYLCYHAPSGVKALSSYETQTGRVWCQYEIGHPAPNGWRDWTYRDARLAKHATSNTDARDNPPATPYP